MADAPSQASPAFAPKHIPYELDPDSSRGAFYENHWKKVSLELLLKHCDPKGKTVLDYGCGRGETLNLFAQAGFRVEGTDVDPECVRRAGRFGKTMILQPENVLGQFGQKSYDVVTCFHVLEHVENPRKTLSELAQVARLYLALAVPNLRRLNGVFHNKVDKNMINEGHLQAWDHWHFLNLAERFCGLELVEWGYDATILGGLSILAERLLGQKATIRLETGLFRKIFPLHGISVLGLFRPK